MVSPEAYRHHAQEALNGYDKSLAIFNALQAEGISWAWTIHPDTLATERDAFLMVNCDTSETTDASN